MKEQITIIQFLPYFPSHKGGVEAVAQEIGKNRTKKGFGKCINVVSHYNQKGQIQKNNQIVYEGIVVGYRQDGVDILVIPSIEIINNFPLYKIWSKGYRLVKKYIKNNTEEDKKNTRILTHTRFFLTSFIGGIFARRNKMQRIHIEHGSGYVKLFSKTKDIIAYLYDRVIGKRIFRKATKIFAISEACKLFIQNNFTKKEVNVFYRGLDISTSIKEKKGRVRIVFIGRLVKLKGVDLLIDTYRKIEIDNSLVIIGDGEEREELEKKADGLNIEFLGFQEKESIVNFLSKYHCVLINPSYQEGLPTTVLEGLMTGNVVIASDVGGTKEISDKEDLLIFDAGDGAELGRKIIHAKDNYHRLSGKSKEEVKRKFSRNQNILQLHKFVK